MPESGSCNGSIDPVVELNNVRKPIPVVPGREECLLKDFLRHRLAAKQLHGHAVSLVLASTNQLFECSDVSLADSVRRSELRRRASNPDGS